MYSNRPGHSGQRTLSLAKVEKGLLVVLRFSAALGGGYPSVLEPHSECPLVRASTECRKKSAREEVSKPCNSPDHRAWLSSAERGKGRNDAARWYCTYPGQRH